MSSGTQSPPLEATGSHIPMGVSSINGSCSKPTKDIDQREGYFSDAVSRSGSGFLFICLTGTNGR
ncbi:hypothetical protein EDC04DRAFT_2645852 [Pisolithus marmoratus]|nr:hypothetical protein EDC04DRAFT_2645852 [Pisolithus marmoratus]